MKGGDLCFPVRGAVKLQRSASETPSALRGAGRRRRSWEVATGGPETSPTAPRRVSPMQSTQGRAC